MNVRLVSRMRRGLIALVAVVLAGTAGIAAPLAQPTSKLDGTWTVVSAERDGKPADELKGHVLTLAGDSFVLRQQNQVLYKGTFTVDAKKKPAHVDFRHTDGLAKGKTWQGIYLLEGDNLKVADNAPDPTKPRPVQFAAKPDSGHVLVELKRVPPRPRTTP